jgi:hypothetical protein
MTMRKRNIIICPETNARCHRHDECRQDFCIERHARAQAHADAREQAKILASRLSAARKRKHT